METLKTMIKVTIICACLVACKASVIQPQHTSSPGPYSDTPVMLGTVNASACEELCLSTRIGSSASSKTDVIVSVQWDFGSTKSDDDKMCWLPIHRVEGKGCSLQTGGMSAFNFTTDCDEHTVEVSPDTEDSSYVNDNGDACLFPGTYDSGVYAFAARVGDDYYRGAWRVQIEASPSCHSAYGMTYFNDSSSQGEEGSGEDLEEDEDEEEDTECPYPDVAAPRPWYDICAATWGSRDNDQGRMYKWPECMGSYADNVRSSAAARPVPVTVLPPTTTAAEEV